MYINVTQTSPGRVKSSETTSVFIVETAISCSARLVLVVYIQEYMPVEIK